MSAYAYPTDLPGPTSAPIQSAERRLLSSLPGPRVSRVLQRDRLATQRCTFALTLAQAEVFNAWWRDDLIEGGRWFASNWPLPQGGTGVRRFIGTPKWGDYVPTALWKVTCEFEVRGRGEVPVADAVLNAFDPLYKASQITLSSENRVASGTGPAANSMVRGTSSHTAGKRYFEMRVVSNGTFYCTFGVSQVGEDVATQVGDTAGSWGFLVTGFKYHSGGASPYATAVGAGGVVGFAVDFTLGAIWMSVNGSFFGDPVAGTGAMFTGLSGEMFPSASLFGTIPAVCELALYSQQFANDPPTGFSAWG